MSREKKKWARAISRLLDAKTNEVVGWLYEWNNGVRSPWWKTNYQENVVVEEGDDLWPQQIRANSIPI